MSKVKLNIGGHFIAMLFCVLSFCACEESVEWELSPSDNGKLVVDAIITSEFKRHLIELSLSYSELNETAPLVSNAEISIQSGQQSVNFLPLPNQEGLYISEFPFAGQLNRSYTLTINWENQEYIATAEMSRILPLTPINFAQFNNTDSLIIASVAPEYHPIEQARYDIFLNWNSIIPGPNSNAWLSSYTFNTLGANQLISPPQESVPFPKGTLLYQKKYGLTEAYGAYLRALVVETEWSGGLFDEASSSLPTNISNDGLGFFAVCSVLTDTLIVQ